MSEQPVPNSVLVAVPQLYFAKVYKYTVVAIREHVVRNGPKAGTTNLYRHERSHNRREQLMKGFVVKRWKFFQLLEKQLDGTFRVIGQAGNPEYLKRYNANKAGP